MAFRLPRLPTGAKLVGQDGTASRDFTVWWQRLVEAIETQEGGQDDLIEALADAVAAIAAAQAAADAANAAAAAADTAAANAQTTADDITAANEIGTSYVSGVTITATDAGADVTIDITAHTRHYPQPDGSTTNVAVNAGQLTGRAYSTSYYIYYDDAARTGGAVTYASTTSSATAAQLGDRHAVGLVLTPAAAGGPISGRYVDPPGPGQIN
jgi:hypothetical protein